MTMGVFRGVFALLSSTLSVLFLVGAVSTNGAAYPSQTPQPLHRLISGSRASSMQNTSFSTPPGYWEVASDGGIFTFGDAGFYGSMGGHPLNAPVVGMASTPDGRGYWEVASDGGIFTFGDAGFYGSAGGMPISGRVVGMASTPDGKGYWLVTNTGDVFAFGDAVFGGSMGTHILNKPVVSIVSTPDGRGYWLIASDGGIFTFGDAGFYGSMGGHPLNQPVVGGFETGSGYGYYEVASDGGIFTFGDAGFYGSMGGHRLNQPVVGGSQVGAVPYSQLPGPGLSSNRTVAAFYYPWWGTPPTVVTWEHWNQNNHNPAVGDIASNFYPLGGPYSQAIQATVDSQMALMNQAGINELISSWWGQGSIEDQRLSLVVPSARAHGIDVAILIDGYAGRTISSITSDIAYLRAKWGITDFFFWDPTEYSASAWQSLTSTLSGVRLFATGDPGQMMTGQFEQWARSAGFQGIFTYDVYDEQPSDFAPTCYEAHLYGLMCSPSVGPGFIDQRANNDTRYRSRQNGANYDAMWQGALASNADFITITSFNEWHEGTQIEPAQAMCIPTYCYHDYNGAYGLTGTAASYAYINRTAFWSKMYMNGI
ncbi:Glycosyl hydrolase family 99 [Ferrithrix thermotolerans DSM 19514]|uniref:Glycosyl hydrolase family 99 n=2 Tax=Ferrithrix TaxID=643949 RepID=A0A1M4XLH6_9ACTN|nr:Glycosyl hydrolase family 99 [Ferrithrix thermotolerans DSM 19514]